MKKFFRSIALSTIALAVIAGNAMAYQITLDVSGERTQSRNATQGNVKAAYYNPAGLVNLTEGIHVDLGNRFLYLKTTTELASGLESESETWTTLLPNAALVWRTGNGALFLTFDIREGGAGGLWEDADSINVLGSLSTPAFNSTTLSMIEGTTYTFGVTLGGAARLSNMLAISGGVRYLSQTKYQYFEGLLVSNGAAAEFKNTSAYGWQGIAGVMLTPMEGLNLTLQFTTETLKTGETISTTRAGVDTYASYTSWSPAMIAFGAGYTVAPGVEVQLSYNYTLEGSLSYGGVYKYDRANGNGHVFGVGAEYKIMDLLTASFGISYHDDRTHPNNNNDPSDPGFDKFVIGFGAIVTPMQNLNIDFGFSYQIFMEAEGETAGVVVTTHNRDAYVIGLGVSYGLAL